MSKSATLKFEESVGNTRFAALIANQIRFVNAVKTTYIKTVNVMNAKSVADVLMI